jgi:hypothetical protein
MSRDDDNAWLEAIMAARDEPVRCVQLIREYYADGDRSDRTPRALLYLHLGMLCGVIYQLAGVTDMPPVGGSPQ